MAGKKKMQKSTGCLIKQLPSGLLVEAADRAIKINPMNAPVGNFQPEHLAVLTSKYWYGGKKKVKLTVGFMENTTQALRSKILLYMNKWGQYGDIDFVEASDPQVRISRGRGGYWSYLGTDIMSVPKNEPTMNLEGFVLSTPDSEYERVVCHEAGHTLGCPHEHMRDDIINLLDYNKTIAYFMQSQGWSRQEVINQVLTPLEERSLIGTPRADETSIMTYQLPGSITRSGKPILGGHTINATDQAFIAKVYPKTVVPVEPPVTSGSEIIIRIKDAASISIDGYEVKKRAS